MNGRCQVSKEPIRVLGIDASLRGTGVGVVDSEGNRLKAVDYDVFKMPARLPVSECLARIHGRLCEIIEKTRPLEASIEGAFFFKNAATAMILGQARGAAIAACASHGIPVYEYSSKRAKQAVTGFGGAGKEQVGKMIVSLLGLDKKPPEDACDALALAICHIHSRTGYSDLMPNRL